MQVKVTNVGATAVAWGLRPRQRQRLKIMKKRSANFGCVFRQFCLVSISAFACSSVVVEIMDMLDCVAVMHPARLDHIPLALGQKMGRWSTTATSTCYDQGP